MLKVTRPQFDFTDSPKYYFGGNQLVTQVFNALSATFPAGEHFFVDAVRYFRQYLPQTDPFQKDISGFIGQEAMHSLSHEKFNAYAAQWGLPLKSIENGTWVLLEGVKKVLTPRQQLAATVCLEHYTAIMAGKLIVDERFVNQMEGVLKDMWLWHAGEEVAHAHVAWDLYHSKEVGGTYSERVAMMILASVVFIVAVAHMTHILLVKDGTKWTHFLPGLKTLFGRQGFFTTLAVDYMQFFKVDFHPNQHTKGVLDVVEQKRQAAEPVEPAPKKRGRKPKPKV